MKENKIKKWFSKLKNKLGLPRIIVLAIVIVAILGLLLPYLRATGRTYEEFKEYPDSMYAEELGLRNKDVINISMVKLARMSLYASGMDELNSDGKTEAILLSIFIIFLAVAILLIGLFTYKKKKIPVFIFSLLALGDIILLNYDRRDIGMISENNYARSLMYYLYIIIPVVIIGVTIWAMIIDKKNKNNPQLEMDDDNKEKKKEIKKEEKVVKEEKNKEPEKIIISEKKKDTKIMEKKKEEKEEKSKEKKDNKVLSWLKNYWYIPLIVLLAGLSLFLLLTRNSSSDTSKATDTNKSNETSEKENNSNNESQNTNNENNTNNESQNTNTNNTTDVGFVGKKEVANNVEYTINQALNGKYVIMGKNNNSGVNDLEITVEFYDKNDVFVGESYVSLDAQAINSEFANSLNDVPTSFDHYKVFIDLNKSSRSSFINELKATSTISDGKVVGQIKNTTNEEIDAMEISIVYYKDNKIVAQNDHLEISIKPGRTANFSFDNPYDRNYKDMEYDNYKIIINEAYSYNW